MSSLDRRTMSRLMSVDGAPAAGLLPGGTAPATSRRKLHGQLDRTAERQLRHDKAVAWNADVVATDTVGINTNNQRTTTSV
jgi:hypothetical protein